MMFVMYPPRLAGSRCRMTAGLELEVLVTVTTAGTVAWPAIMSHRHGNGQPESSV